MKVIFPAIGCVSDDTARHSMLYTSGVNGLSGVMMIVFGSSAPATLAAIFMGDISFIPDMPLIERLAPENFLERFSEKRSSIFSGALTVDLSSGVEPSSLV